MPVGGEDKYNDFLLEDTIDHAVLLRYPNRQAIRKISSRYGQKGS
jgi:hypothetical protein